MELNEATLDMPARDAASVVLLRDGAHGPQVLLMRRHANSNVLGGAYVFPGGKLDREDWAHAALDRLDAPTTRLHAALGEPALAADTAAGLFICALREAFEESGLILATDGAGAPDSGQCSRALHALRQGTHFSALLAAERWRLDTHALAPWSRWITPRRPAVMNKRFDTRFFLAAAPRAQEALHDDFEVTEARWLAPRDALIEYRARRIDLAPPQILSLMHLLAYPDVAAALADARSRPPPLVEPHGFELAGVRAMCYPGDPEHPVATRALPTTTRLVWRGGHFEPPEGFDPWLG